MENAELSPFFKGVVVSNFECRVGMDFPRVPKAVVTFCEARKTFVAF